MAKKVLILVVVVVLVLLAAPYAIGMFTQSALSERIESYDANPSLAAAVDSYERGWRTSHAVLHIGPSETYLQQIAAVYPMVVMLQDISMPVMVEIEHGPVLLDDGFALGSARVKAYVDPEWEGEQMARQLLGMPYLFELRGQSGFGTGFRFEGEVPPFDGAFGDLSYVFSGFDFTGHMQGNDVEIDGLLANASLQASDFSAVLESLSMSGEGVYEPYRLPLGTGRFAIARMTATNPMLGSTPAFDLRNMAMESSVSEQAGQVALEMVYSGDSLSIAEVVAVRDWAFGLTASSIDAEAMHNYYALAMSPNAAADTAALGASMMPLLDRILAGSPQLLLEPMKFSMDSGDFDGRLVVSLDGSALPNGSTMDLQNTAVMMSALDAELEASASKPLAQELAGMVLREQITSQAAQTGQALAPEQVQAMAAAQAGLTLSVLGAQGLLVDDGTAYSTRIEFRDGTATANGQPIPLGF